MHYLKKLIQRDRQNQKILNKKIYFLNIFILVLTFGFTLMYFFQINGMVYKGYTIKDSEQKLIVLKNQNRDIEMKIIELQSIQSIIEKAKALGFVENEQSEYIDLSSYHIAQR